MPLHKKTTFEIAFVINALLIAWGDANVTRGALETSDTFRSGRALWSNESEWGETGPGSPCC